MQLGKKKKKNQKRKYISFKLGEGEEGYICHTLVTARAASQISQVRIMPLIEFIH